MDIKKINDLTITELNEYEKACALVCRFYENIIKTYDGNINTNTVEYKKLQQYNNIRIRIIEAMEEKINKL
jgi:hypothetical protein